MSLPKGLISKEAKRIFETENLIVYYIEKKILNIGAQNSIDVWMLKSKWLIQNLD